MPTKSGAHFERREKWARWLAGRDHRFRQIATFWPFIFRGAMEASLWVMEASLWVMEASLWV
jgi:hypothetical protein